ncbi:MAG: hypothetical protein KDA27_03245 [Candidatus Eisenbacteria bacterium]|uniref:Uncharacterized protein n=1 Tax=Eiseniibacteriota bacterium TaxID=2212470 RepID=A0A956SBZ2_UNCEI|nr:hypothetical protein [Candidatus Eisenbacteria bacterium]MCB9464693.1 hypothetical protein [Candidatus Eisenbacteria bacterium]
MAHAKDHNMLLSSDGHAAARAWFDFPSAILALCLLVLSLNPGGARAAVTVPGAPGVVVIPADEVLKDHTVTAPDGTLLFTDRDGVTWRLITDPEDPEITNPSVSGFYPADWNAVVSTLDALPDHFLWTVDCVVYVLPYPRSGALSSSAADRAIYLSPGVQPLEDGPVLRSTVVHEYGHAVHYALLPDDDPRWDEYRKLRGIEDDSVFYASAAHAYRPHEIFAEDFRVLFGDPVAAGDGSVENPELDSPQYDADLIAFFESLPGLGATADVAEARVPQASWQVFPNPVPLRGRVQLERTGGEAAVDGGGGMRALLVDASGRRAGELQLAPDGTGRWSASLADVEGLSAGAYWLVLRAEDGTARSVSLRVVR